MNIMKEEGERRRGREEERREKEMRRGSRKRGDEGGERREEERREEGISYSICGGEHGLPVLLADLVQLARRHLSVRRRQSVSADMLGKGTAIALATSLLRRREEDLLIDGC